MRAERHLIPGEERVELGKETVSLARKLWAVGAVTLGAGFVLAIVLGNTDRFFQGYLVNYCFFLSVSIGALFFVALQHLTGARWSVAVRRLAELLAGCVPVLCVLFLPVLIGGGSVYEWMDPSHVAEDELLEHKGAYLNVPFFLVRCAAYFGVWLLLAHLFLRRSVAQDASGDPALTQSLKKLSPVALLLLGVTVTLAAFDFLMSLDPHWYSTIFGVYFFAGAMVAFLATLVLVSTGLQAKGILTRSITTEHYHDAGKLLFGFVFFWGYIAFSQYLLIWYGDIPEETVWYLHRQSGAWGVLSVVLLSGHFLIPFVGLMSRHAKRNRRVLAFWAAFLLLMHWLDLYWLVLPEFGWAGAQFVVVDIVLLVGLGALFLGTWLWRAGGQSLLPRSDPHLADSLAFKNV